MCEEVSAILEEARVLIVLLLSSMLVRNSRNINQGKLPAHRPPLTGYKARVWGQFSQLPPSCRWKGCVQQVS